MAYYKRRTARPRRKLQQLVQRREGPLVQAARLLPYAGAVVRGVRQGLQMRNQIIANQNRNVQYRNARKAATSNTTTTSPGATKGAGEITWTKASARTGGRAGFTTKQLAKLSTYRHILRYQNIAPTEKGVDRGAMWLTPVFCTNTTITGDYAGGNNLFVKNNSVLADPTVAGTFLRTPYHLYCLNMTNLSDAVTTGPALQPFIAKDTGAVSFTNMWGMKRNSVDIETAWQTEWKSQGPPTAQKYIKQDWYQIKLALRNAQAQATWFDIWVFQFKDGYLDPFENPSSVEEIKDRKALYQGLAASSMTHPMMQRPGLSQVMKKLKFLKKVRIVMDKQSGNDMDLSPDVKLVNLFIRDGKMYDYQYAAQPTDSVNAGLDLSFANSYTEQGPASAINSEVPKARARVWLMVRAHDPTNVGSGNTDQLPTNMDALTATLTPSYDVIIRKCELAKAN